MNKPRAPKKGEHPSKSAQNSTFPQRRPGTIRLPDEIARHVRDGHPWVFAEALRGRIISGPMGQALDLVDSKGKFVARALAAPSENPVLRVFSSQPEQPFDQHYLHQTLRRCLQRRLSMLSLAPSSFFRLLNGDCEGVPGVAVDAFGPYALVGSYFNAAESFLNILTPAISDLGRFKGIYLQRRLRHPADETPRRGAELIWGQPADPEVVVTEGQYRFVVDVTAPASPGIYPDMRWGRHAVGNLSGGKRVLNCFSYTGAFSVVAALNGATEVVSVDISSRANARARRNFVENKLNAEDQRFAFETGDTFAALAQFAERKRRFDLIVLDPPTFSTSRGRTFTAMNDYSELVAAALEVLDSGGLICAASNAAKLSASDFDRALGRGALLANRRLVITHRLGQPPDYPTLPNFPEGAYLKFFVAQAD